MEVILLLIAIMGIGTGAGAFVIRNLYYICQPSEVLIFAGSTRRLPDGRKVGYRLLKGGSSIRTPLLEKAFRMDLTNMIIELKVSNAYSKGGIPLAVEGVANIKIAGSEPTIHNAIERLLGKSRVEIEKMARETLEGNLRGVLASLTPEQVNEDKIAFAKSLLEEAEDDLEKLGLVLDTLQIQNISDDVRYLDSIGRKQIAELRRDARIAEAQAKAESEIKAAENEKITAIKRIERDIEIAKADAERRVQDALTMRGAMVAEADAEIKSEVARTQAEVAVQQERIKQVEQQLQADVVAPAEAECKQAIARAKGNAAPIIEDGKARAMGTKRLAESWQQAGPNARDIFLFQKLEVLLDTMVSTVPEVDIENITVIDSENGSTATKMAAFLEQFRQVSGVDFAGAVRRIGNGNASVQDNPPPPPPRRAIAQPAVAEVDLEDRDFLADSTKEERAFWHNLESDVEDFLNQIASKNPSNQQAELAVRKAIQRYPKLRQRLQRALEKGGEEALRHIFDHPMIKIPTAMIAAWARED